MPKDAKVPVRTPARVSGVADALEALERKRRPARGKQTGKPAGRKGDLDLDCIP